MGVRGMGVKGHGSRNMWHRSKLKYMSSHEKQIYQYMYFQNIVRDKLRELSHFQGHLTLTKSTEVNI